MEVRELTSMVEGVETLLGLGRDLTYLDFDDVKVPMELEAGLEKLGVISHYEDNCYWVDPQQWNTLMDTLRLKTLKDMARDLCAILGVEVTE